MALEIRPMPGGSGAVVTGIDLREPVDATARRALEAALVEHIALVIRDQHLTPPQYVEAIRIFGELADQQFRSKFSLPEYPTVQVVSNQEKQSNGKPVYHGRIWHSDHTHEATPPNYTVLYALEVPSSGGATCIANMRAAYESLSESERRRLDTLRVQTCKSQGRAALKESTKSDILPKDQRSAPGAVHPLIRTHPVNGTKAIYFHAIRTDCIEGMTPEETKMLLADLLERATAERFVYRHRWKVGDILIWDNRSAMHQASFDYDPAERRILHRLILRGSRPVGPAMPAGGESAGASLPGI
jgi:taurine dioxygenase